jgi:hypothetical protein
VVTVSADPTEYCDVSVTTGSDYPVVSQGYFTIFVNEEDPSLKKVVAIKPSHRGQPIPLLYHNSTGMVTTYIPTDGPTGNPLIKSVGIEYHATYQMVRSDVYVTVQNVTFQIGGIKTLTYCVDGKVWSPSSLERKLYPMTPC